MKIHIPKGMSASQYLLYVLITMFVLIVFLAFLLFFIEKISSYGISPISFIVILIILLAVFPLFVKSAVSRNYENLDQMVSARKKLMVLDKILPVLEIAGAPGMIGSFFLLAPITDGNPPDETVMVFSFCVYLSIRTLIIEKLKPLVSDTIIKLNLSIEKKHLEDMGNYQKIKSFKNTD